MAEPGIVRVKVFMITFLDLGFSLTKEANTVIPVNLQFNFVNQTRVNISLTHLSEMEIGYSKLNISR